MAQEDDLRALGKIMDFMRGISVLFLLINCYWFCYSAFETWHFTLAIIDKILLNFQRTTGLFSSILWTKFFCVVFLGLSCLGTKGVKEEKITWGMIYSALAVGFVLFFLNWWLLVLPISAVGAASLYIFSLSLGYICLLMAGVWMSRLLKNNLMDDVFNMDLDAYEVKPQFFVINFDDPRKSHRCNPINLCFMTDISDAYESAYTIMLNLNRSWIQKQGDFFVESPIILLAAIIWFLKIYEDGKYCTFPHAIEFLNRPYAQIFPILTAYDELANYLSPFMDAWEGGAQDQFQGQIASAKIPLSRMISPALYWVMTGDDFSLDINNPREPKVLVVGNNPDRQNIYSAALGLYNSRIVKLINKKKQLKSSVIIDELPTIYFRGLDNLIATARSNKVAVCLGFQDFSQLTRDYGDKESKVIQNTVGNVFSGQVVGETAKTLSERFGKVLQQRQSMTINRNDKSTSISTQLDSLIPASKISNLTQGMFVGAVSDNFDERIEQKIFHAEIVVDSAKVSAEMKAYEPIPVIAEFINEDGSDNLRETIEANYKSVKSEILTLVKTEIERIKADSQLCHLIKE